MATKTEKKNIHQRMHAVMKDISYVQKEEKKVNNQYRFVSHDAVTAKLRAAMVEHGIVCLPSLIDYKQDGNRTEASYLISFTNIDDPADTVEIKSFGYGIDPQDKGPGKACSYAVKYALLKAFCLETGDDPERDLIPYDNGSRGNNNGEREVVSSTSTSTAKRTTKQTSAPTAKSPSLDPAEAFAYVLTQGTHAGTLIGQLDTAAPAIVAKLTNYANKYAPELAQQEKTAIKVALHKLKGDLAAMEQLERSRAQQEVAA
jgi:hypothetical protein